MYLKIVFISFSLILFTFDDLLGKGVSFYVSSQLRIYEESSTRVIPKGGSKLVFKDVQVYNVFTQIENENEKAIEANWSMVVRNMEGTELFAKSFKRSGTDKNWGRGASIPQITNEKELYVTVIIKSLVIRYN